MRKVALIKPPSLPAPAASASSSMSTSLVPMFTQPSTSSSFHSRINQQRVCLESAFTDGQDSIAGTVRVLNISFHKTVIIRWTTNDWSTLTESTATYVKGSSRDGTDQFRFKLKLPESLSVGERLQFCLKFICEGEHWDSNGGSNYVFQVNSCYVASQQTFAIEKVLSHVFHV